MAWKINFLHVFKFRPLFCNQWAWKPVKTIQHMKMPSCGHIQHHIWWFGTDFRLEIASSNHWNGLKNHFFAFFQISSPFWVPNDQIWCWIYPQEGIFMCWVVFTGFQVYWLPKSGRNLKKCKKLIFQPFQWLDMGISSLKSVPNHQIWCWICPQEGIFMCWVVFTGFQAHWLQKSGRNLKKMQKNIFQAICLAFNVASWCQNLIHEPDFGALWVLGKALGYAKMFTKVCLGFPGI